MTEAGFERLYSAAARMLVVQGSPTWREDRWPEARRLAWRQLEAALTAGDSAAAADGPPEPARELVTVRLGFASAVRSMRDYLRDDLDGVDEPLVVPGIMHTAITESLDELTARLAPGRPAVAVSNEGGLLARVLHELADALRTGLGLPGSTSAPAQRTTPVRDPRPPAPGPAGAAQLASAAKAAADSVPTAGELAQDFSVRHAVAVAADDVRGLVAGENRPAWRERQADIEPGAHLVAAYRWEGERGRPLGFAERAAELTKAMEAAGTPWCPTPDRPLPEPAADRSWVLYSRRQALVTADLLDELAARLMPGRPAGTILFSAYPLQEFLTTTIRAGTTEL